MGCFAFELQISLGKPGQSCPSFLERQQALNVLGLPSNATPQQIKRRYRTLAKQYHPDRGGDQQQMKRIIAAYEFLSRDQPKM